VSRSPDTLTFADILDAVDRELVTWIVGWQAVDSPGEPKREAARRQIAEALSREMRK